MRGIDAEKYRKFRAVLVARDETLGEWLEKHMEATVRLVGTDAMLETSLVQTLINAWDADDKEG